MDFAFEEHLSHPAAQVFATIRDALPEILPLLPSVESVERERAEAEGAARVHIVQVWQADIRDVPAVARPFVNREYLRWRDVAVWDEPSLTCTWEFHTMHFDRLYECRGVNYFEAVSPDLTRLRLTGSIDVHPERVPGVPRLLARSIRPRIEAFLVGHAEPNLRELPRAVQSYLDARAQSVDRDP